MKTPKERFEAKYTVAKNGCWIWTGAVGGTRQPRPQIRVNWKCYYAARFAWELYKGPIQKGMNACHTCDEPLCVNPEHLFLGGQRENMRDASRKGRFKNRTPLNEKIVTQVKALHARGFTQTAIAAIHSLPLSTVGHIVTGRRWGGEDAA